MTRYLDLQRNPTDKISFLRRLIASGVNPAMSAAAKTKAEGIINENAVGMRLRSEGQNLEDCKLTLFVCVAVFSKSYCPYCQAAKQLLTEKGARFYTIELDQVGMFCLAFPSPF